MQPNPLVDQPRRCCAGGQFRKVVIVICALAAAVIACSGPGRSADLPEVSVAALAKVATIWPLLVAEDRGILRRSWNKIGSYHQRRQHQIGTTSCRRLS